MKNGILCVLIVSIVSIVSSQVLQARPKPILPPGPKAKAHIRRARARKYKYIRSHDLNHDGKVTVKDRVIWLNNHKGKYNTIYISADNEDILEVMDSDGDGKIEAWEMKEYYDMYDLNKDGVVDQKEIDIISE